MTGPPSIGATAGVVICGVLAVILWVPELAILNSLHGSDAAGNAISQGFAAIGAILLWLALSGIVIVAAVGGRLPPTAVLPGVVLIPLSGVASMTALDLMSHRDGPPYMWPIVIAATGPLSVMLFGLWTIVPRARAAIPVWLAASATWGTILIATVSIWPMHQIRHAFEVQREQRQELWEATWAKLPRDAPLWDWFPLLITANGNFESEVLEGIQHLDRRQSDAEIMLERGDFPLEYLNRIDLTPTPRICELARALLRRRLEPLILKPGETKPFAVVRMDVTGALAAMSWLVGYDCPCEAEALAWETMAKAYTDPGYYIHELRDVRDPKHLGRILRESPERFSMLSPKSHLKAWLHYAKEQQFREAALRGARALDHRTEQDAIDMLVGSEYEAWDLLIFLPELELEATPGLCDAALSEVHRELNRIWRPGRDDPRPYSEMLQRFGTGEPLRALIWLTEHGCETEAQLIEADGLIRSYEDSPDKTAMLATLGGLMPKRQ